MHHTRNAPTPQPGVPAHLDRPVPCVGHGDLNQTSPHIQLNPFRFRDRDRPRFEIFFSVRGFAEDFQVRNRQERTPECLQPTGKRRQGVAAFGVCRIFAGFEEDLCKVSVLLCDWAMDGEELGAIWECGLDLNLKGTRR